MHIAVTGATGFIGQALVARLVERGHGVRALVRRPGRLAGARPAVEAVAFDALAAPAPGLVDGCDAVIHLAGEPIARRWSREHKERVRRTRVEGTGAVARAAIAAGTVKALISASGVGYYGPHGSEPLTEDSPPGSDFLAEVCKEWEEATAPAREAGIRAVHLRLGVVLHPGGGALERMLLPFKLGLGGRLGSGEQYMSWIHRDDLVSLLAFALEAESLGGPVNATAPNPVTNAEFARVLGQALHRPALLPVPALALRLALGEMATVLLEGQRVLPSRALAAGFTFAYPRLDAALAHLLGQRQGRS